MCVAVDRSSLPVPACVAEVWCYMYIYGVVWLCVFAHSTSILQYCVSSDVEHFIYVVHSRLQ